MTTTAICLQPSFRFRRDPRASDLTDRIVDSIDLLNWFTVIELIAGSTSWDSGVESDHPIVGAPPLRETDPEIPITPESGRFLRLMVVFPQEEDFALGLRRLK